MKNNTSQTPHNVIQSGSGDHPSLALRFFEEIDKMGYFGQKYAQMLAEEATTTGVSK